jgi:ABC-type uncharacterized transport system permease subunit
MKFPKKTLCGKQAYGWGEKSARWNLQGEIILMVIFENGSRVSGLSLNIF